jgi:hypothetical protein
VKNSIEDKKKRKIEQVEDNDVQRSCKEKPFWHCEWFKVGGINVVLLATLYVDHFKQYYSYHNMAVTIFFCQLHWRREH